MKLGKDYKVERYRATGNGGQNVNKVESAVRITHLPSGIQAQSQDERDQHKNFKKAWATLQERIETAEKKAESAKINEARRAAIDNGRIRTYNFITKRVTNHKNGKSARLEKVLNGELRGLYD